MEYITPITMIVEVIANIFTIIASGIAIYIYVCKREEVKLLFRVLVNYSYQTTLTEIKGKLDRLNEYNAKEQDDIPEIINIFHEIAGQIKGNEKLQSLQPELIKKIEAFTKAKKITEPNKRALVSEVRELLKNINVESIEEYL